MRFVDEVVAVTDAEVGSTLHVGTETFEEILSPDD